MNTSAALGSNATFQCTVRNAEIKWRVNGLNIDWNYQPSQSLANERGIYEGETWSNNTTNTSRLLVLATKKFNDTAEFGVACVAFGGVHHNAINSPEVYLSVFGMFTYTLQ